MENVTSRFLAISGVCAIVGSVLHLLFDIFRIMTGRDFEWSIGMWLAFVFLVPAILGFAYYLASLGSRLAYLGGALAFFGAMAGASMQVLFRTHAVLAEQGATNVVEQLRGTFKLVASTQMIGLPFPIGLLLLSIALFAVDRSKWLVALVLSIGAIAFPIGRIAFSQPAVIVSGICFLFAFGAIGLQLINNRTKEGLPA